MERSAGVRKLFRLAKKLAADLGVALEESSTGGGSDGNFTAALGVPTLDGLGAVGEGAHAVNESILVNRIADRTALLAKARRRAVADILKLNYAPYPVALSGRHFRDRVLGRRDISEAQGDFRQGCTGAAEAARCRDSMRNQMRGTTGSSTKKRAGRFGSCAPRMPSS